MLQGGVELFPDAFIDLLSHGPPHFLLFCVLVFALNPCHPVPLLIKLFAQQTGNREVWDSVIGSAGGAVVEDFVSGPFKCLPHPLLLIGLHPFPHILCLLLMPLHVIGIQAFFHEFSPPDGQLAIEKSKER